MEEFGVRPVLVTAPHNAYLLRDGQQVHVLEEYTSWIARAIARELTGATICWTQQAQWHTEMLHALGQRRRLLGKAQSAGELLDPRNRDPNYLLPSELAGNPWFLKLREWASHAPPSRALHLDVHGCRDPPKHPAHAMLGFGAMRQHAERLPELERRAGLDRVGAFARALEGGVGALLAGLLGVPPGEAVVITGLTQAVDELGNPVATLQGAWPPGVGRLTQTQQSVSYAGVGHALQLELSWTLRHELVKDPAALAQLACTIRDIWLRVSSAGTSI